MKRNQTAKTRIKTKDMVREWNLYFNRYTEFTVEGTWHGKDGIN